jgi:hypothetical protein
MLEWLRLAFARAKVVAPDQRSWERVRRLPTQNECASTTDQVQTDEPWMLS